jgi:hypothetical protein
MKAKCSKDHLVRQQALELAHEMGYDLEERLNSADDNPGYVVVFMKSRGVLSGSMPIEDALAWLRNLDCPF